MVDNRNNEHISSRASGPKTSAGKQASRCNSLKHGFTSTKLLPEVLNKHRVGEYRCKFEQQYLPANPTEQVLVTEMARHAAMMELGESAEIAVLRNGARELSKVILGPATDSAEGSDEREDAILSAAVSTDALDKFNRYRRGHEKAFYSALKKLREMQAERSQAEKLSTNNMVVSRDLFATESACEKHLINRFQQPEWRCPHCEDARGSWLIERKRWECSSCGYQAGLRHGTVTERSRLPLRTWFLAISELSADPNMTTSTLASLLGLKRLETVRSMMKRIHSAVASENANELLMGLTDQPTRSTVVCP